VGIEAMKVGEYYRDTGCEVVYRVIERVDEGTDHESFKSVGYGSDISGFFHIHIWEENVRRGDFTKVTEKEFKMDVIKRKLKNG